MMDDSQYRTHYQLLEDDHPYTPYGGVTHTEGGSESEPLRSSGGSLHSSSEGSGGLIIHTVPDRARKWNHINDLDNFFRRLYRYHQMNGFHCIMLRDVCDIIKYLFVVSLTVFLVCGVNFSLLLGEETIHTDRSNGTHVHRISLTDGFYSFDEAMSRIGFLTGMLIAIALLFFFGRMAYILHNLFPYWEIKEFYNKALEIPDKTLQDRTWDEIKKKIMKVQEKEHMCVHKDRLTALDIYQRILRNQNYMVALINQNVIPVHFPVPFYGEIVFLTKGYEFNLNFLLFWGSHSMLHGITTEQLRRSNTRQAMTADFEKKIFILAIANFVLMPFIFAYQVLYALYHNVERLKNEPGSFGDRCWSLYGRIYLRHYNELDHELNARLNRAYKAATSYLISFTSPSLATVADLISFFAQGICGVLIIVSFIDDDILRVEHVLSLIAICITIIAITRGFIPDENMVFVPELLMERIVANIHYQPDSWTDRLHTTQVRSEFSRLFQYKFVQVIEELLSPAITPFILLFSLRSNARKIVDFFHMFTVQVEGLGNVCSFAQMDVQQHGTVCMLPQTNAGGPKNGNAFHGQLAPDGGRTELSLLHFACLNPEWQPPKAGAAFLNAFKAQIKAEHVGLDPVAENPLGSSSSTFAEGYANHMVGSVGNRNVLQGSTYTVRGGSVSRTEGPLSYSSQYNGHDHHQQQPMNNSIMSTSSVPLNTSGYAPANHFMTPDAGIGHNNALAYEMGRSALYFRGLCNRQQLQQRFVDNAEENVTDRHELHQPQEFVASGSGLYPRSPSPPAVQPFHDALLSQMVSEPSQSQYAGASSHAVQAGNVRSNDTLYYHEHHRRDSLEDSTDSRANR